jgi:glycosyltransferase involved in cell wall biosynthesis
MLKVGIFLVMSGRRAGGPETYERCLVDSLLRVDPDHHYLTYSLAADSVRGLPPPGPRMTHRVLRPSSRVLSTAVSLPLALLKDRVDLLHAPFTPPPFSTRPYVFTHHCFSTFNHPEFYAPNILFRLNALLKKGLKSATRIICVSRCTLELTAEHFGLDRSRMQVVYNGVGAQYQPHDKALARQQMAERYGLNRPYLLYLGKLESRKNIVRILQAFDRFRQETRDDALLVLAGARTPMSVGIDETIASLRLQDSVREIGYVPDADLPLLYSAASMFVFPSLWEGFGIPVIEAMACGTPVLTSNLSSLPEVSADAALLVDPYRVDEIVQGMLTLWRDRDLCNQMVARGLRNAKRFSWDTTARETMQVYRDAVA